MPADNRTALQLFRAQLAEPGFRDGLALELAAARDPTRCTQRENFLASYLFLGIKAFDELEDVVAFVRDHLALPAQGKSKSIDIAKVRAAFGHKPVPPRLDTEPELPRIPRRTP